MEIYDFLYSKEALNIYFFLFSNEQLTNNEKEKIKDLICIAYMYNSQQFNQNKIEMMKRFFESVNDIRELDNVLVQDVLAEKMYYLFPLHRGLLQGKIKEKYEEALIKIKSKFIKIDFDELQKFLETKNYIDNLYQRMYDNEIRREDAKVLEVDIAEKLSYLEKYIEGKDIEAYRMYFRVKTEQCAPEFMGDAKEILKIKDSQNNFSELIQLRDLEEKSKKANKITDGYFEEIDLTIGEKKEINYFVIKEIIKQLPVLIGLYLIDSTIISSGIFSGDAHVVIKIVLLLLIVFSSAFLVSTVKYILIFIFKDRFVKGKLGFVADIKKGIVRE